MQPVLATLRCGTGDIIQIKSNIILRHFPLEKAIRSHIYNAHLLNAENTVTADDNELSNSSSQTFVTELSPMLRTTCTCTCPHCSKELPSQSAVEQHVRAKHGIYEVRPPRAHVEPQYRILDVGGDTTERLEVKDAVTLVKTDALIDTVCSSHGPDGVNTLDEPSFPTEEIVVCVVCKIEFSDVAKLRAHLTEGVRPPPPAPPQICDKCGHSFRDLRALYQHANFCLYQKKL